MKKKASKKKTASGKRRGFGFPFGFAVALSVFLVFAGLWLVDNKLPNYIKTTDLYVYPGDTPSDVISKLDGSAVSTRRLERAFRQKKVAEFITPGHYVLNPAHTAVYTARMLNNGWQTPARLTLAGTLRRKEDICARIANQMLADSSEVFSALSDAEFLASLGTTPRAFFEIIIPDTYEIYWTSTPKEILATLKAAADKFWTEERLSEADALGLSRKQVTIIASIVKGETNCESEMPRIAGVYINRLKTGMKLQADPTIAYCYDYSVSRILYRHLKVNSPYNTYAREGLPPGPICCPTKAALDAVLNADFGTSDGRPGKDGNIFFCASPAFDGTHRFAKTSAEHSRNARAFQAELDRRVKAKAKK